MHYIPPPPPGGLGMGLTQTNRIPPKNELEQQIKYLQKQMANMNAPEQDYTMKDICPYTFDKSIPMPLFPPHFVTAKFDKHRGKGDPKPHLR